MKKKLYNNTTIILAIILILLLLILIYFLIRKSKIENFNTDIYKLEVFTANWCGHCKKFMLDPPDGTGEWNKLKDRFRTNSIEDKCINWEVSNPESRQRGNSFGEHSPKGFPTFILTKNDNYEATYNGPRTSDSLCEFYNSHSGTNL